MLTQFRSNSDNKHRCLASCFIRTLACNSKSSLCFPTKRLLHSRMWWQKKQEWWLSLLFSKSLLRLTREHSGVPRADRDAACARGRYQKVTSRKFFISANAHPFSWYRASKLEKCKLWAVITRDLLKRSRWPNWHFCRPCWGLQSRQYSFPIWSKRYWAPDFDVWRFSMNNSSKMFGLIKEWISARL